MLNQIHFPKQNTQYYYDYHKFEFELLRNILSGNAKQSSYIYSKFFTENKLFNLSEVSELRSIKNQTISLLSVICHNGTKFGVSPYSSKSMLDEAVKLIDKSSSVDEIYNISKSIVIGFSVQTLTSLTTFTTNNPIIKKALNYIHDNLGQSLSLEDVSSHVHLSKYYFCTQFKKEMHMSFVHYLNYTRIEKSKFFLCHSDKSILDIAILLGFSNQEYFTSVFKKYSGTTPSKFRLENKSYY